MATEGSKLPEPISGEAAFEAFHAEEKRHEGIHGKGTFTGKLIVVKHTTEFQKGFEDIIFLPPGQKLPPGMKQVSKKVSDIVRVTYDKNLLKNPDNIKKLITMVQEHDKITFNCFKIDRSGAKEQSLQAWNTWLIAAGRGRETLEAKVDRLGQSSSRIEIAEALRVCLEKGHTDLAAKIINKTGGDLTHVRDLLKKYPEGAAKVAGQLLRDAISTHTEKHGKKNLDKVEQLRTAFEKFPAEVRNSILRDADESGNTLLTLVQKTAFDDKFNAWLTHL
jgi:hypothetical protein